MKLSPAAESVRESAFFMGIAWEERLATGIDTADEQHRELFGRIDTFLDACDNNRGKTELIGEKDRDFGRVFMDGAA